MVKGNFKRSSCHLILFGQYSEYDVWNRARADDWRSFALSCCIMEALDPLFGSEQPLSCDRSVRDRVWKLH